MNISWLKLDINILNDSKIKMIRKYPAGDSLLSLWIGLLCLAMKSDKTGYIYIADGIPYTDVDLANEFDIDIKTVQMGLELFKRFKMIDFIEGDIIEIINFNKHQQIDLIEEKRERNRIRQAEYRAKQRNALVTCDRRVSNTLDKSIVDKNKIDKTKEKKIAYREYVHLKESEYNKLLEEYGEKNLILILNKLDDYKGYSGKKYKDDYRAIKAWVISSLNCSPVKKDNVPPEELTDENRYYIGTPQPD